MVEAGGASTGSAVSQPPAKKLARDVLETFMLKFTDMAEKETNPAKFERYAPFCRLLRAESRAIPVAHFAGRHGRSAA